MVRQLQGVLPRISFRKRYGSISHSISDLNHCAAGKDGDRADVGAAAALQTLDFPAPPAVLTDAEDFCILSSSNTPMFYVASVADV